MDQVLEKQSSATKNMEAYFATHDVRYVAEDAEFLNMATGERTKGREAIGQMLHYIYHVAFHAKAEILSYQIAEDKATMECNFTGVHIGEFAGIPATNKTVNVPLCITYDIKNGLISQARIYMLVNVMMDQLFDKS